MPKQIGLLGGTFDPVHFGHISIAGSFLESGHIDELWILLTPLPPHKQQNNYAGYKTRLRMLEAAFAGMDNTQISTVEYELSRPSYTINTIRHLKKEYPDINFYFCLGEDSLQKFHTWKFYEKIIGEVKLLAAKRPGAAHESVSDEILQQTLFIEHEPFDISSSQIRKKVKEGLTIDHCVPEGVLKIIEKEQLYR